MTGGREPSGAGRPALRPRLLLLVAAAIGPLALVAVLRGSAAGDERELCRASLIPAYAPPAQLKRLATADGAGRRLVILNPASGPGEAPRPAYERAAAALRASGARVLGYVATAYGGRDPEQVVRDAERYRSWYGVDGIFLDEAASEPAAVPLYRALGRRLRALGASPIVLNPGRVPARGLMAAGDVVVTFEGSYADYATALERTPSWLREQPARRVAHLVYGASREQALRSLEAGSGAGLVFFTDGELPNPWASIPPYLGAAEAALRGACAGRG